MFNKAIKTTPNYMYSHRRLGEILLFQFNRPQEAKQVFNNALKINPNDFHILLNLGRILYHTGDYNGAVDALSRARKIHPNNLQCLRGLALSYRKLGNIQKATQIEKLIPKN
jgi:tetratricopeptide (TPR) repeat protein